MGWSLNTEEQSALDKLLVGCTQCLQLCSLALCCGTAREDGIRTLCPAVCRECRGRPDQLLVAPLKRLPAITICRCLIDTVNEREIC